jgi:major type 1 subunit fimbrin (pilin)
MKNSHVFHRFCVGHVRFAIVGLAAMLTLGCESVQAQNARIGVTGTIIGGACRITTPQVDLGVHPPSAFEGVGTPPKDMDWVDVLIVSQGCDADIVTLHMGFDGTADTNDGRLFAVAPGGARGLGIQLQTANGATTVIPNTSLVDWVPLATGGIYAMRARYLQTLQAVTPGAANSTVTVMLSYN